MPELRKPHDLQYAPPAPAWSGAVSAAVGAMAMLWISAGLAILFLSNDKAEGARAMKLVLLTCVPSTMVGLVLGLAGRVRGSAWSLAGVVLNGLVLAAAAALVVATYWRHFF
jgi:hypothetical protein